jgi:hypothetical protein
MLKYSVLVWAAGVSCMACGGSKARVTAAEIDCPASEISIGERSTTRGTDSKMVSWTAECRGDHYFCTRTVHRDGRDALSCVEQTNVSPFYADTHRPGKKRTEPSVPSVVPVVPAAEPFTSAAGFAFGSDVEASQAACEGAGHKWHQAQEKLATCSGPGEALGFDAQISITFCEARLCGVTVRHRPESNWLVSLVEIKRVLVSKYGEPADSGAMIPGECRSEAEFVGCLETGRLTPRYVWGWRSGERLKLIAGKPTTGNGETAIRLYYTKRNTGPQVEATGL